MGSQWAVATRVVELPLKERFTIARESWDSSQNVFVTVRWGDAAGSGEVSPADRWGETVSSVVADIRATKLDELAGPFDLEGLSLLLPPGAARCALDIALHDLAASLAGISVAELLGVGGRVLPPTSVTIPITDAGAMQNRARSLSDHPVLKMKVGFDGDVDAVRAVREVYTGTLRVDANEGWRPDEAAGRLKALEPFDIELCEQPITAGQHRVLRELTDASAIPVFADEDVADSSDVGRLDGVVDGVNLKLRKAGGIRATVAAIATARALGMKVMLGCDLESGIAATAEANVAALADHADLDGPLLLRSDPWPGVSYDKGIMTLPPGPGLGVAGTPV
ncbi:MAG: dipeptide epimerase [Actinomycetota bacterium]|nr:dipeptide epimerase [Actinomycetota bacterium]